MTMMSWQNLLNANRLGSRKPHDETARSPFHKDYDRIVFSGGFRRLNRKTPRLAQAKCLLMRVLFC